MAETRKWIAGAVVGLVVAAGATGIAVATGGDDSEPPITGADYERAADAALAHTGGGQVTETEVGDEDSYYEVEVTLDDGSQVDVQLDEDFNVVGSSQDVKDDEDGADDD